MSDSSLVKMKQEAGGGSSPEKVKEDATHRHNVTVKFNPKDGKEYRMTCTQPCTVLELLKTSGKYSQQWSDENILIQKGKGDNECGIPTHFPCTCVDEDELLAVSCEKKMVEAKGQHEGPIPSRDSYSVFNINLQPQQNTKSKKLFRNNAVKNVPSLCVYGKKGMTVEEALKTDGRFIDDLITHFILTDSDDSNIVTEITQPVEEQDGKKFKVALPYGKGGNDKKQGETAGASNQVTTPTSAVKASKQKLVTMPTLAVVKQEGISVKTAMTKPDGTVNIEEIRNELRKQFPHLKEWMEKRFPGDSYQKALEPKRENFGKFEQSFSEIHRVRELLKMGESVCKVLVERVEGGREGTGFVLFDNYILTNAHLFKGCVKGEELKPDIKVYAIFNYEKEINSHVFHVEYSLICPIEEELDYAVLQLNPRGIAYGEIEGIKIPPGLLKSFAPMPENGECGIIGHPGGKVKQMDLTFIIEKGKRGQAADEHLHKYRDILLILQSIKTLVTKQSIENIMMGGKSADKVGTYHTFMYHGSSGSPVFNAQVKVFGLHTAGFFYHFPKSDSVIEFAQPVLTIFEHFVNKMKETGKVELLKRVKEEAQGNSELENILDQLESPERMETS